MDVCGAYRRELEKEEMAEEKQRRTEKGGKLEVVAAWGERGRKVMDGMKCGDGKGTGREGEYRWVQNFFI